MQPPPDDDGDGIANNSDNCVSVANPGQDDLDTDGIGDACDDDIDGDGYTNDIDQCDYTAALNTDNDSDGCDDATEDDDDDNDGMPDTYENTYGLNPLVDDANDDFDRDGLTNYEEYSWDFDPTRKTPVNDFTRDLVPEILIRNSSTGIWQLSQMNGSSQAGVPFTQADFFGNVDTSLDLSFAMIGAIGNGRSQFRMVRSSSTGEFTYRSLNVSGNAGNSAGLGLYSSSAWSLVASCDHNQDGAIDFLMRKTDGSWRLFLYNKGSSGLTSSVPNLYSNTSWVYKGCADFDDDGDADVLMRSTANNKWRIFYSQQDGSYTSLTQNKMWTSTDVIYQGLGDFDFDGDVDILTRKSSDNRWKIHALAGGLIDSTASIELFTSTDWQFKSAADYDGDGDADILLRKTSDGKWRLFPVQNSVTDGASILQSNLPTSSDWGIQTNY
jgi:hypothetical protein